MVLTYGDVESTCVNNLSLKEVAAGGRQFWLDAVTVSYLLCYQAFEAKTSHQGVERPGFERPSYRFHQPHRNEGEARNIAVCGHRSIEPEAF